MTILDKTFVTQMNDWSAATKMAQVVHSEIISLNLEFNSRYVVHVVVREIDAPKPDKDGD